MIPSPPVRGPMMWHGAPCKCWSSAGTPDRCRHSHGRGLTRQGIPRTGRSRTRRSAGQSRPLRDIEHIRSLWQGNRWGVPAIPPLRTRVRAGVEVTIADCAIAGPTSRITLQIPRKPYDARHQTLGASAQQSPTRPLSDAFPRRFPSTIVLDGSPRRLQYCPRYRSTSHSPTLPM